MGLADRLERMVCGFCSADRKCSNSAFHVCDRYGTEMAGQGIYGLSRNGIGLRTFRPTVAPCIWSGLFAVAKFDRYRSLFSVTCGNPSVQMERIPGRDG